MTSHFSRVVPKKAPYCWKDLSWSWTRYELVGYALNFFEHASNQHCLSSKGVSWENWCCGRHTCQRMYWKGNYVMYITLFKYIYLLDLWPYFVNGLYRTTVGEDASIGSCLIIWATQLNYLSKSSTQTIHHGQGSHLIIEFPVACWETKRQGQAPKAQYSWTISLNNMTQLSWLRACPL